MLKYKMIFWLVFAGNLVLLLASGSVQCLFLAVFLLLFFFCLFLAGKFGMRGVQISCSMQEQCFAGHTIYMKIQVNKQNRFSIGCIQLTLRLENVMFRTVEEKKVVLSLGQKKDSVFAWPFESANCGKVRISAVKAVGYDMFSLTQHSGMIRYEWDCTVYPEEMNVTVYPKYHPQSGSDESMNEHVRRGEDVSEIFDIREYQDGDNLRAIHWKLSSKQDKLLVREFGEASSFDTLILFQIALTGQEENIAHNLLNYAIRLGCGVCTSLARQGIGYHLGLMNEGDLQQRAVENPDVFMRALTEYMSMPIPKYTEDLLRFFMASLQYQKFRRIVLISGRVDAVLQKRLAEYVNLTVIVPAEDGVSSSALTDGYDLISISMNEIGEKEHYITI